MACGSLVRWTAIPVGSRFILETQGDDNLFHATATVALNGAAQPNLEHDAIVGGTAILDIDATRQRWTIEPVVILTGNANPPYDDGTKWVAWKPDEPTPTSTFEGVDAVIHLAGDNVAEGRWSEAKKRKIL